MTPEQALLRLQRLCSHAEKCTDDVLKKLWAWDVAPDAATDIVAQLQASGFLDERRYVQAFVHDKCELTHWGTLKIRMALRSKKISDDIIDEALQAVDKLAQAKDLAHLLSVKNKSLPLVPDAERKMRLLRFAVGRGYEYEMAANEVNKLLK
ncbi:MAG: RecX family transcriptional regulator [Prevotellaceae bacterium]|jgi:regulatory protein|nr:RecX family transcriptional regulator [Prevotellaceae bacterium]